jgi:hypothetical protein
MSDSNKNLVMGPRWRPGTGMDWLTDRWSQNNLNLKSYWKYKRLKLLGGQAKLPL